MNEDRKRILNMLAENKITAQEAEALLDALSSTSAPVDRSARVADPKFLRVLIEGGEDKINVRVPLQLVRAGMRLAALIPATAHGPVNKALQARGIDLDISKIKPEDFEELVEHLRELTVDVESTGGEKVRVFCE